MYNKRNTMSKKHFVEFARHIANIKDRVARRKAAATVADVCKSFNPKFDTDRFYKACGV